MCQRCVARKDECIYKLLVQAFSLLSSSDAADVRLTF